ncbi:unnamed protein product [Fraxinus pennsylvanica]|uniref:EIPR1-like beta-propeller domain-containing protein n=1 Tax=Fraxinus pennsylvanica TaxID=56036 RepID=A0AAD2DNN2_9LAMI|nr:unnamed protein product [Fraxinus pennsylvanica]
MVTSAITSKCVDIPVLWWPTGRHDKLVTVDEQNILLWNIDTSKKTAQVTAEDETGIHIWDLRKPKYLVSELPDIHTGHGQLNSAGTDSAVNLWSVPPNSDDYASDNLVESPTRRVDALLHSYTDYEDSVYDLAWSSREPWIFASLSYDGRIKLLLLEKIYILARCIFDVKADTDRTSFLTSTLSLKEENEDLASCPFDQCIFSTVFFSGESYGAATWQILELYGQQNSPQLERIASLDAYSSTIKWHDKLVIVDEQNIFQWNIDTSKKTAQVQSQKSSGMLHYLSGGAWDAHDVNTVALTRDLSVQLWDLRTMKTTNSIQLAHVRNVDYNTKKKYMPSAGTDSAVNLWLVPLNSDDYASDSLVESPTRRVHVLLHSYTDYEEYLAWSSREPWIFSSLSYDGRVVVESIKPHLPKK